MGVLARRAFVLGAVSLIPAAVRADETRLTRLLHSAHQQTRMRVTYDSGYTRIAYPMGDVAPDKGVCTDVIIRAYRAAGIDLQQRVHEDMQAHFALYPKNWGLKRPDSNIDHRRVPNLRVFLGRFGKSLTLSRKPEDYAPGDLVTYRLPFGQPHIAMVSDERAAFDPKRPMIIHNIGAGPKQEDALFSYEITGHFRYEL
jgi:uncharacterized protein